MTHDETIKKINTNGFYNKAFKLKGKTKIELFENGHLVSKTKDSNISTNILSHFFEDLPLIYWWDGSVSGLGIKSQLENSFLPLYSKAMGGIFLFDSPNEENVNMLYPDFISNFPKFYAGGEYAGSDPNRGSYNTNESGPIPNGWRHVWDFGTDKANGSIASLSLTNVLAGNSPIPNTVTFGSGEGELRYLNPIYFDEEKFILYRGFNTTDGVLSYEKVRLINPNSIGLLEGVTFKEVETLTTTLNSQFKVAYVKGNTAYMFRVVSLSLSSLVVEFSDLNILSGATTSVISKTISPPQNLSFYTSANVIKLFDGVIYIYLRVGSTGDVRQIASYSVVNNAWINNSLAYEGTAILNNVLDSGGNAGYFKIGDFYAVPSSNGTFLYAPNKIVQISTYSTSNYYYRSLIPFEGVMTQRHYSGVSTASPQILPNYLATINNLSSPVIKTNAQTMKVTYEITQV